VNTRRVADALNTIAVAFGELAEAIAQPDEQGASAPRAAATSLAKTPVTQPAPSYPPGAASADYYETVVDETLLLDEMFPADVKAAPREEAPQGSLSQCPKHRIPYEKGQYGLFCKQRTDDPAWGKDKNGSLWCRITPRNADVWLRSQAAAAV
jgi:hypothetical protein